MKSNKIKLVAVFSIIIFSFYSATVSLFNNKLRIWFFDVGQGDAILIETPKKKQILIDGGPNKKAIFLLGRQIPFWDRKIEAIFLSHPHADHSTGLIEIFKNYKVDNFYSSFAFFAAKNFGRNTEEINELKRTIDSQKTRSTKMCGEKKSIFDGIELWIFWPLCSKKIIDDDLNASSLTILLKYGDFEALFLGDLPNNYQSQLPIDKYFNDIEVIKIAHHGAKDGASKLLLERIKPDVAIISVGRNNRFGHPKKGTLEELKKLGIKLKRTDRDGTVEIVVDKKGYRVMTER